MLQRIREERPKAYLYPRQRGVQRGCNVNEFAAKDAAVIVAIACTKRR
jgi:hypothetical protein